MDYIPKRTRAIRSPRIKIDDDVAFFAIRIAKSGYYGGSPELVKKAPVRTVLQIMNYENFEIDLREAHRDLNDESR